MDLTRPQLHSALALGCLAFSACAAPERSVEAPHVKPNVIVILADDLGLGDVRPSNPECQFATPALDRLAAGGLTFSDAHSPSSVCTPTRYGLLTGRYNWRSRLARGVLDGASAHLIPAERPTLAHLMRSAGYSTAMIGKWHLGWDWATDNGAIDFEGRVENGPDVNGFERYFAHAASLDMPPYVWVDSGSVTGSPDREEGVSRNEDRYGWYRKGPVGEDFMIDEVLPRQFDEAIASVAKRSSASRNGQPFFLYLALSAPHTPIVPREPFAGASGLNPYADFVQQIDHHLGELLDALEVHGVADDTLIVFTSDNGCSPEANMPLLREAGHDPSAGFRGHKAGLFEGAHRIPLIVRWPRRVPANRKTDALACLTDVYATLAEITGQTMGEAGGEDSHSWVPIFDGHPEGDRTTLVSHSISGHFAFRRGEWKLLLAHGSGGWSAPREGIAKEQGLPPIQLYNLTADPGETTNVAADHPAIVDALLGALEAEVRNGRSTAGEPVPNDREVSVFPAGVDRSLGTSVSPGRGGSRP